MPNHTEALPLQPEKPLSGRAARGMRARLLGGNALDGPGQQGGGARRPRSAADRSPLPSTPLRLAARREEFAAHEDDVLPPKPKPDLGVVGGAERDRTADLLVANEALSQLSYSPTWHKKRAHPSRGVLTSCNQCESSRSPGPSSMRLPHTATSRQVQTTTPRHGHGISL